MTASTSKTSTEPNSDITAALAAADSIEDAVFVALGMASVCWIPRPVRSRFDSEKAALIGEALIVELHKRYPREAEQS